MLEVTTFWLLAPFSLHDCAWVPDPLINNKEQDCQAEAKSNWQQGSFLGHPGAQVQSQLWPLQPLCLSHWCTVGLLEKCVYKKDISYKYTSIFKIWNQIYTQKPTTVTIKSERMCVSKIPYSLYKCRYTQVSQITKPKRHRKRKTRTNNNDYGNICTIIRFLVVCSPEVQIK